MPLTAEQARELDHFPAVLLRLIEAELAAGNAIVELGPGHPAPPAGACVRLALHVTTRPRSSGEGLVFRDRRTASEFSDAEGHYFVCEPATPLPPLPGMEAIRAGQEADMDAIRAAYEPEPGGPPFDH